MGNSQRLVVWGLALLTMASWAAAAGLDIVSMAPQGVVEEPEQQRIRLVFSRPMVPLAEVEPRVEPPPWLTVTPPILARWRWAGTAELIGEPQAPLPRATTFEVRLAATAEAIDGATLKTPRRFTFSTPRPSVTIAHEAGGALDTFAIVLTCNQPVDPASLAAHLTLRLAANPLPPLAPELVATQKQRLAGEDAEARAAWERFLAAATPRELPTPAFTLEPDPQRPHEVFRLAPVGSWPPSAKVEIVLTPGIRSLEGPLPSDDSFTAVFPTPWPFGPLGFAGRTAAAGFDPDAVQLVFSSEVTWRDLSAHLTVRAAGEAAFRTVAPFAEEWEWEWPQRELSLTPLGLAGGSRYEVCLDADTVDAAGRRLGFPWCGTFATSHKTPACYLVEGDGVVEWSGPHLLPLRVLNVTSYTLAQRTVREEELVPLLREREETPAAAHTTPASVPVTVAPDRSAVLPIDLDQALGGRPGVVLTQVQVATVLPGSEYDEEEARWLRQPRTSVTQVTSLGLTVKGSRHEGLLIWVTDLAAAKPVAAATVTARSEDNVVLWRGTTDAQGLARTPATVSLDTVFLVTARRGDDLAYTRSRWWEGHRGYEFNLPVDYHTAPPLLVHVWPDRGVVRPGESLHLKAVVREQREHGLALPPSGPFTFVVRGPGGDDEVVVETSYDRETGAEAEIRLPETAPLGRYEVVVGERYDRGRRAFAGALAGEEGCSFLVAEFRRPKFRTLLTAEPGTLVAGDALVGRAEGRLLAGGAMGGAPARWRCRARRSEWRPAGSRWSGFETLPHAFLDEAERDTAVIANGEGQLDAMGNLAFTVPRVEAFQGWPTRLEVEVEVTDADRQSSTGTASVLVLPGEFVLGLERPPFFIAAAHGLASSVVALTPDGTPRPGIAVEVLLLRRHWESVRRREVSGRYVFESTPVTEEIGRVEVATADEPVPLRLALEQGGEYALLARARDGRGNTVTASTSFYVFGSGFAAWRFDRDNRIELVAERQRFAPGQVARILVKSPWERATALVTVERAGVLQARVEELAGTMPTIEVPIEPHYTPNVFVSVVLLRGRVEAPPDPELVDPGRPAYRVGMCELAVPPTDKRLAVSVATGKAEYRPGQPADVTVTVAGADGRPRRAAVTLWAVDAGILSLTAYRTPDPMATFYARRGLGVTTAESRSRLVGRRSYGTKGDKAGGGGGIETTGEEVRRDFRALAFWQGTVLTDASGRATVRFPLPDSLTTYRVMAVAAAGADEFGWADREMLVTKPLGLEPALPRFLRPADSVRAGVLVRNRTVVEREVEVTLTLPPGSPLTLRGTATRVARVPAHGTAEVGFGLVAVAPGVATITFAARAPLPTPETDLVEVPLPVLPAFPTETVATFFASEGEAREAVAVPADAFPEAGGLSLRLAPTALVAASSGVRFLQTYPYDCSEQLASRVLGVTAALRLGEGFAPVTVDDMPRRTWLAATAARLVERQRADGGFAFWPGGASSEELSAYVAWALVELRRAGVAVGDDRLVAAAAYLSRHLRQEGRRFGEAHDWTARVLLSFALAQLGRAEPAYFQALVDTRREAGSVWGRALLATTMLEVDRRDRRAATLLDEVRNALAVEARTVRVTEVAPSWGWRVFWSEPRSSAAALMALLAADPRDPSSEPLARGLVDHLRHDRFLTTHATAWMLQALAGYRERHEGAIARGTVEATLADRRLVAGEFAGREEHALTAEVPMVELQRLAAARRDPLPLAVRFAGEGRVHTAVELTYAPRRSDRPPVQQGLGVGRRFLDRAGREVGRVAAGDEVVVEITVTCPAPRRWVAVDVPLPAGLEAIDPNLATTASDARLDETTDDVRPGFDRIELRDDRIVLFATELPTGRTVHTVRCRATTQGSFLVAPGKAEEMYAPEVFATTGAATFEVAPARR